MSDDWAEKMIKDLDANPELKKLFEESLAEFEMEKKKEVLLTPPILKQDANIKIKDKIREIFKGIEKVDIKQNLKDIQIELDFGAYGSSVISFKELEMLAKLLDTNDISITDFSASEGGWDCTPLTFVSARIAVSNSSQNIESGWSE